MSRINSFDPALAESRPSKILWIQSCVLLQGGSDEATTLIPRIAFLPAMTWRHESMYASNTRPQPVNQPGPPKAQFASFLGWCSKERSIHKRRYAYLKEPLTSPPRDIIKGDGNLPDLTIRNVSSSLNHPRGRFRYKSKLHRQPNILIVDKVGPKPYQSPISRFERQTEKIICKRMRD